MTFELGPQNAPDLVAGVGMLAIAALLLWVAPTNRVHRAFALLQFVAAGNSLAYAGTVGYARTDPVLAVVLDNVWGYFVLAGAFAVAFFALRFLDPDGRSRASRPIAWSLLVGVVGVLAAFAIDHDLLGTTGDDGTRLLGPLGFAWYQPLLAFGAVAFMFAIAARRAEAAPRREGLVLGALAFMLIAAYWTTLHVVAYLVRPESDVLYLAGGGNAAALLLARSMLWLGLIAILATAFLVLVAPPLGRNPAAARSRRLFGAGAAAAALSGVGMVLLLLRDPDAFELVPYTLDGAWRVVMTLLLAYALLKRQLFDAEVRLRFAISRSTVAAVFIAVFFVASEAAQQFFGDTLGSAYVGIAAAGALVFAIAPLQRAADRLAARAIPVAAASSTAHDTYRHAVRVALADGAIGREEERALARMQRDLGLDPEEALDVREEIEAEREHAPSPAVLGGDA